MHPYWGVNFFEFFAVLLRRIPQMLVGADLAPDEVQMLVLICVAISGALVGSFLVLRRMTMLANSLSHTVLLGLVISYILFGQGLFASTVAALITAVITALLTEFLRKVMRLQEDASIGLVFSSLFALGIVVATLWTRNAHIGLDAVMGNVDALQASDLKLVSLVAVGNLALILLFFKEYQLTTFDAGHARSVGMRVNLFHYLLVLQAAATVVGAFRAVGVVMVLAFLVGPPLMARRVSRSLAGMLLWSAVFGSAAAIVGVALARHLLSVAGIGLSTGGLVVCVVALFFAVESISLRLRRL
jgi:manganese/zinc/iron transport system permease protein